MDSAVGAAVPAAKRPLKKKKKAAKAAAGGAAAGGASGEAGAGPAGDARADARADARGGAADKAAEEDDEDEEEDGTPVQAWIQRRGLSDDGAGIGGKMVVDDAVESTVGIVRKDGGGDDGESTEMQPLAAPDETPVKFERSLVVNGTETVVVDNEDQLPTSTVPAVRFCLLGSEAHRRALMEKRKQTEEAIALAEQARLAREAEEARLTEEAERLDRQIHALDERRETHEEALKENIKSAEDGQTHSTAHRFGTLKHFVNLDYHPEERLIRKPIVRQFFRSEVTPDGTQREVLYREAEHRSATWNELFFDLVMVAVLHSLGHTFAQNYSGAALERFLLTFAPIWLVWTDMTYFLNIHDNGDLIIKIFVYVQMVFVVGMGASATNAFETTTNQFVGAFLLARVVLVRSAAGKSL